MAQLEIKFAIHQIMDTTWTAVYTVVKDKDDNDAAQILMYDRHTSLGYKARHNHRDEVQYCHIQEVKINAPSRCMDELHIWNDYHMGFRPNPDLVLPIVNKVNIFALPNKRGRGDFRYDFITPELQYALLQSLVPAPVQQLWVLHYQMDTIDIPEERIGLFSSPAAAEKWVTEEYEFLYSSLDDWYEEEGVHYLDYSYGLSNWFTHAFTLSPHTQRLIK